MKGVVDLSSNQTIADVLAKAADGLYWQLEFMERLKQRCAAINLESVDPFKAAEIFKTVSNSFVSIMDMLRKFSLQEAALKLECIALYDIMSKLPSEERTKLSNLIKAFALELKQGDIIEQPESIEVTGAGSPVS